MTKEKIIASIIGLSVLILVNLPIFYFYLFPKNDLVFMGRRVINSQDTYTYVSFIEESKQGKIVFDNLYTTDKETPSLIRPSYLVLGKFAGLFNISSIAAFHLGRILLSIALIIAIYKFISKFFDSTDKRLIAFTITLFSSGLGFLLSPIIPNASDLWIPESNTFLSMSEAPHFILSQILILSGFMLFLNFLEKKKPTSFLFFVFCFLFLAFEHPYDLFVIGPVIFLTTIFATSFSLNNFIKALIYGLASSFGIIYQIWQAVSNPILKNWQVDSLSPTPTNYLAGFGLLIPLAIIGAEKFLKETAIKYKFILIWVFVILIAIYSPFNFQRRLIEGIHLPLAILATTGLFIASDFLSVKFGKKFTPYFINIFIFILSLSSIFMIINDLSTIRKDSTQGYYYYITRAEYDGMSWLKQNTADSDGILANWFYGNMIPGTAGRRVYLGHKAQSGNFDQKVSLINQFLLDDSLLSYSFLKKNNINYIYIGNNDSMISYGFKPDSRQYLERVYSKNGVAVYEVR